MQLELQARDERRGDNERRDAHERGAAALGTVPYSGHDASLPMPPPDSPVSQALATLTLALALALALALTLTLTLAGSSDSPPDSPDNVARSLLFSFGEPDFDQRRWTTPPRVGSPSQRGNLSENPSPGDSISGELPHGLTLTLALTLALTLTLTLTLILTLTLTLTLAELPHGWEAATDEIGRTYYFR
eukprot:scaffold10924_cov51-Phaeocystis_antarctica.AAC.3